MLNQEIYALTEEDIESGKQDFFTQLLIEAKKQKTNAKTLSDLSSNTPTVSYLVGQPGAGKTSLGKYIEKMYIAKNECVVEIGSDKIATYHKYYNELLKLLPDDCYIISRQFVRAAEQSIYQELKNNKINLISEVAFNKGEKDYKVMEEFKKSGYKIEVNIIAVDKYESFLSCVERDIKLLELGYDARPVARMNHDRMYEPFVQEIIEMNKRELIDSVNVYVRGKALNRPQLVYKTGSNSYPTPEEAIIYERAKSKKQILSDYGNYLNRIKNAKENIMLLVQDEVMKNNYLKELEQLEKEFINELSFERNIN